MADTTEARRLADEADAVLAQLDDRTNQTWAGKRQRWATLIRSMLDERKRLTSAIEKYEADDVRYMVERKRLQEERDELRAQVEALRADAERWQALRHVFHVDEHIGKKTGMPATKLKTHWAGWVAGTHYSAESWADAYIEEAASRSQEAAG